jgi:hypothetical protein
MKRGLKLMEKTEFNFFDASGKFLKLIKTNNQK